MEIIVNTPVSAAFLVTEVNSGIEQIFQGEQFWQAEEIWHFKGKVQDLVSDLYKKKERRDYLIVMVK
jgi:hypothetical protein